MNKKIVHRFAAFFSAAVLSVGAACMFTGCTSKHPEVTVTYEFQGTEYKVGYTLSRSDAPQTVQHFIELADAGYYDGTCIHDYDGSKMYGGGYTLSSADEKGDRELQEKHYFTEILELEAKGHKFTQSVWADSARTLPLYTVYGEFKANGYEHQKYELSYRKGALVMYYTEYEQKDAAGQINVTTKRNDGGKGNDGDLYDTKKYYTNNATSLFYTVLKGSGDHNRFAIFGQATAAGLTKLEEL